ncbi:hypothetical protein SAMN05414139_04492 [Burkholderia sp. D7]|nr:hypothetical protein SAMN05414139_04492 [Burkholderia sp. D7]
MNPLDPILRPRLAQLAELIVPRHGRMPAASEVGVAEAGVDAVLAIRPDLSAGLLGFLARCPDAVTPDYLSGLADTDPDVLALLLQVVAGAYYMDARVRALIGYDGQKEIAIIERPVMTPHGIRPRRGSGPA